MTTIPIYIACDLTAIKVPYERLIESLHEAFATNALVGRTFFLRFIGFSGDVQVLAPLGEASEFQKPPSFNPRNSKNASYEHLFKSTMDSLNSDMDRLCASSPPRGVRRPILIIITSSPLSPADDGWLSYQAMMATARHPIVIAVSMRESASLTATEIATDAALFATGIESVAEFILSFMEDFFSTLPSNDIGIRIPTGIKGMKLLKRN